MIAGTKRSSSRASVSTCNSIAHKSKVSPKQESLAAGSTVLHCINLDNVHDISTSDCRHMWVGT